MNIFYRFKHFIKTKLNTKIHVVFICNRPKVWRSLDSLFNECLNDNHFRVTIVAIPNKKPLNGNSFNHDIYESEGAEEYFKKFPCRVINGYDYKSNVWISLKSLEPDYVFFQQPYNITRYKYFKSKYVSKYCKLMYVHYAENIIGGEVFQSTYPPDFFKDVSTIFTHNEFDQQELSSYLKRINTDIKLIQTGFPRYDNLDHFKKSCSFNSWLNISNPNSFKIIWTPRWCTSENNCHFFDYKDEFINYIKEKKHEISFMFRPHPQAFSEWLSKGQLSKNEYDDIINKFNTQNSSIDYSDNYLDIFYSSDVLITDISSIIAEYFPTGKPIIYCHKTDWFNDFSRELSEGFYWVRNWNELISIIQKLKNGEDPLKEKREELIKKFFVLPGDQTAGYRIKEEILHDYYS